MADEKKSDKSQDKYSSRIYLVLMAEGQVGKGSLGREIERSFAAKKRKYPNAKTIYLHRSDLDDRDDRGVCTFAAPKYDPIRNADNKAKITILGHHGEGRSYLEEEGGEQEAAIQKSLYSVPVIARIIKQISHPDVRRRWDSEAPMPEQQLKISLFSCCGESFARDLMQQLDNIDGYQLVCNITTGSKDKILWMFLTNKLYLTKNESIVLGLILALPTLAVLGLTTPVIMQSKGVSAEKFFSTPLSLSFAILLSISLISWGLFYRACHTSNAANKVVVTRSPDGVKTQLKTEFKSNFFSSPAAHPPTHIEPQALTPTYSPLVLQTTSL